VVRTAIHVVTSVVISRGHIYDLSPGKQGVLAMEPCQLASIVANTTKVGPLRSTPPPLACVICYEVWQCVVGLVLDFIVGGYSLALLSTGRPATYFMGSTRSYFV
jgi:hypothetical protein